MKYLIWLIIVLATVILFPPFPNVENSEKAENEVANQTTARITTQVDMRTTNSAYLPTDQNPTARIVAQVETRTNIQPVTTSVSRESSGSSYSGQLVGQGQSDPQPTVEVVDEVEEEADPEPIASPVESVDTEINVQQPPVEIVEKVETSSNEPTGFELASDRNFDALNELGWASSGTSEFSIVTDPTAPTLPNSPNVGQALFPKGLTGGYAPMATDIGIYEHNFTKLFVSFWIKISDNWQGHPVVNKIGYFWIHGKPVGTIVFVGEGSGPLYSQFRVQNTPDGNGGAINFESNITNAEFKRNQWQHLEILLIANTGNNSDGEIHWWLDDTKAGEYKNVRFGTASQSNVWELASWRPVWGGIGSTVREDQYMWLDNYYVSGSRGED